MNKIYFYASGATFFVFAVIVIVFTVLPALALYRILGALTKVADHYQEYCDYNVPEWRFSRWMEATIDKYFDAGSCSFKRYGE